jgi:hypothetical protein
VKGPQETIYFDATANVLDTHGTTKKGGQGPAVGHLPEPQGAAKPGLPPPSGVAPRRNEVEVRAGAQGAIPKHPTLAVLDEHAPFPGAPPTLTEDALNRYFSAAAELSSVPGYGWDEQYQQFNAIGGPSDLSNGSQPRPPSREGVPGPPQGPGGLNPNLPRFYPPASTGIRPNKPPRVLAWEEEELERPPYVLQAPRYAMTAEELASIIRSRKHVLRGTTWAPRRVFLPGRNVRKTAIGTSNPCSQQRSSSKT